MMGLIFLLIGTVCAQKYTSEEVETMFSGYRHEVGAGVALPLPPYGALTYRARFGRHAAAVSAFSNPAESLYAATLAYLYSFAVKRFEIYWGLGIYASYTPKRAYNALSRERYYFNLTVKETLPSSGDTTFARYSYFTADASRSSAWGAGAFLTLGAKLRIPKRYALGVEVSPLAYGFTRLNVVHGERREYVKNYPLGDRYVEERIKESEIPENTQTRRIVGDFPLHLIFPKLYFSVAF